MHLPRGGGLETGAAVPDRRDTEPSLDRIDDLRDQVTALHEKVDAIMIAMMQLKR